MLETVGSGGKFQGSCRRIMRVLHGKSHARPSSAFRFFKFPEIDANSGWCKQKQNLLKDYARTYSIQQKIREPDMENNKSQVTLGKRMSAS